MTFWLQGAAALESVLANTTALFRNVSTYYGASVHFNDAYSILPLNGFSDTDGTSCNTYGGFFYGYTNDTTFVSMRLYNARTRSLLAIYDVTNYVPGPWSQIVRNAGKGPYAIELYDAAGGVQATATSPIGRATCNVMG